MSDIAIAGIGVTKQAKRLPTTTLSACLEAARLAIADAGVSRDEIDGIAARWPGPGGTVFQPGSADWAGMLGIPVRWIGDTYPQGVPAVLDAAAAIAAGLCHTVLIVGGQAGVFGDRSQVASYTRPENEFVAPFGSLTMAQFALVAQRYLHRHPDAREGMAAIAAAIRNTGSRNPNAVMYGRGPFTTEDVLSAPKIVEPFTLLEICLANEGAAALVVSSLERVRSGPRQAVRILGGGAEWYRQQYVDPPRWEEVGRIGADAAARAFAAAGIGPQEVDVLEIYDVTSFEVVRQLEALGFCGEGEGADFALQRGVGVDGGLPICTDGGTLSYSHIGWGAPTLKVVEAVRQLRGECGELQVPGAEVALVTGAGAGAQYHNVLLLGRDH